MACHCLGLHREDYPGTSPFLQLSLDTLRGLLPQLAELKQLRQLTITSVAHTIGQREVDWMGRHWPRLRSLELPILNEYDGSSMCDLASLDTFDARIPDYARRFLGLQVAIPARCYTQVKYRHVYYDWEWSF